MKHYLITGGTGLIGSALCKALLAQQHHVTVLSRTPRKVGQLFGSSVRAVQSLDAIANSDVIDVVVNLAGEPISDKRWTQQQKQRLEQSRIDHTRELVDWLGQRTHKPESLISGSAVGWYGDATDTIVDENSGFHDEYTHQLCDAWEQQALRAQKFGIRVCTVRTGLVLSTQGGVLQKLLVPFKLGLGGKLGSGQQYMPWIHIDDMTALLCYLMSNQQLKGPFNACSPNPVTNKKFTQTLAMLLHRPAFFTVPACVLKSLLGEMSQLLLTGQRAMPVKLEAIGYKFIYTDLHTALADLLTSTETHHND